MLRILFVLSTFCALLCSPSLSQSYLYDVGNQPWGTNIPVENGYINVNNGEIHMEFSLATHSQRGGLLNLNERLVYDSRIWQIVKGGSYYSYQPTNVPGTQGGWRFIAGNEAGSVQTTSDSKVYDCIQGGEPAFPTGTATNYYFTYTDPSGAQHYMLGSTSKPTYNNTGCPSNGTPQIPDNPSTGGGAIDGSGYTYSVSNYTNATVYDPSGNQVYPTTVDRNGNYYSTDSNGNLVDTIGRTPVLTTTNGSTTYYDVLTSGGGRARYTVTTSNIYVHTGFNQQAVVEYNGTIPVVTSITLPDQSSYQFTYDVGPADGNTPGYYGELASVTLPTGGVVQYGYSNFTDSFNNVNRWLTSHVRDRGTTTYSPKVLSNCSSSSGCQEQVTVTSPANNDVVYSFSLDQGSITEGRSWITSTAAYSGQASNGTLLHSTSTSYAYGLGETNWANGTIVTANVPTTLTQTSTLNDVAITSQTVTNYFSGVLPSSIQFWDYYSGATPSNPTETTSFKYQGTNHGGLNPGTVTTTDSNGNIISQTTYSYDETSGSGHAPIVATSGLPQQPLSVSGPYRGNLTTITQWVNSSSSLSMMASYDNAGMKRTSSDPNGTTTFSYDGTGAYASGVTPPTPTSGVSLAIGASVDGSIGLPLSTTDPNGVKQQVTGYDAFNRPNEQNVVDSGGTMWARATFTYSANALVTHSYQSKSVFTDSEVLYDAYGRTSRTAISNGKNSNPWYQQDTCYDSGGNVSFVSYSYSGNGFSQAAVCSGSGDSYTYDALGRITSLTHADGTSVTYHYAGRAKETTDENGVSRIVQTDALGRITAVCELSSNSSMPSSGSPQNCGLDYPGSGFITTYAYDLANHKTTISQGSQVPRVIITDGIGRQTSFIESEHSKAATSYTYAYNSQGLLITRSRPITNVDQAQPLQLVTTSYQYDSVGRIIAVRYSDGTPNKTFTYDQSGNGGSIPNAGASIGRLTIASSSVHGRSFQYDPLGNITMTVECLADWCGQPQHDVFRYYQYDWQSHPTFEAAASQGNNAGVYSVAYNFNRAGQFISIIDGMNNGSGAPNMYSVDPQSMTPFGPQTATYGNNLVATSTYDGLGRFNGRWLCGSPGGFNCPNSTYVYGQALSLSGGRVTSSASASPASLVTSYNNYTYDDMGRLTGSSPQSGSPGLNYTATYDRYGNRWSQMANMAPNGAGPSPSFTFNTGNNQILYVPYDEAGNLAGDFSSNSYQYDADNNLISINGGQTATYAYGVFGERIKAIENGVVSRFGSDVYGRRSTTWQDNGTLSLMQYYSDAGPVAFWTASDGKIHFEHQDWVGTERIRTDVNGNIDAAFNSFPYGETNGISGSDLDPNHYALLDSDVSAGFGVSHAGAREYITAQGHWMSPDSYQGSYDPTNPQSFNRYTYALNSPVSRNDPTGLFSLPPVSPDPVTVAITIAIDVAAVILEAFLETPGFEGSLQPRPTQNFQRVCISGCDHVGTVPNDPISSYGAGNTSFIPVGYVHGDPVRAPDNPKPCSAYSATGTATYYNLPGQKTASGAPFNPNTMNAAMFQPGLVHMGDIMRVSLFTNPAAFITVTINDTGPFLRGPNGRAVSPLQSDPNHLIDLTPTAFMQLNGSLTAGHAQVNVSRVCNGG